RASKAPSTEGKAPNPKTQARGEKFQIPNPKLQKSSKIQAPIAWSAKPRALLKNKRYSVPWSRYRKRNSPSPRPSPSGRGRSAAAAVHRPNAFVAGRNSPSPQPSPQGEGEVRRSARAE